MDPNENIKRQRELADKLLGLLTDDEARHPADDEIIELCELVTALDEWRLKGGYDPYGAAGHGGASHLSGRPIKKGWLYDEDGGTEHLTYAEWAKGHIQDDEAAREIAQRMIEAGYSDNFDEGSRVFETYTVTSVSDLKAQMRDYENEGSS